MKRRRVAKFLKQKNRHDLWIAIISIGLSILGVLMIYESSNVIAFQNFGDKYHFIKDQTMWLVISLISLVVTSFISYKKYYSFALILLLFSLLSLVAVFIPGLGVKTLGAHRWIGIGAYRFQPAEFAKLIIIIYLSSWFISLEKKRFIAFLLLFFLIVGLVMLQPDLGTASIITSIFIVMYFLSGAPLWHFAALLPVVGLATLGLIVVSPYRFQRLLTFININNDPLGISYHVRQILISFGSGGLFGVGLGASKQKYQFLPEAMTDSIFAIIGEEFGFIGSIVLIALFIILLFRIFRVARHAPDRQSFLLSSGIFVLLAFQIIINLGSMVTLFPLTGVPLPFISYGGSNLVVSFIAIGIILNISKYVVLRK